MKLTFDLLLLNGRN